MMLRVMSLNCNGIRAAHRKGFYEWLETSEVDVVCLQEVRAHQDQLNESFYPSDYHCYFVEAEKRGYSGVAILSKKKPNKVVTELGYDLSDIEGRYIHVEFDDLIIASLYLPSGTSGDERQALKYDFMDWYYDYLLKQKRRKKEIIICGDWNIAHKQIDIKNWKSNQKNSGFLPEERAWMDKLFDKFTDAFRVVDDRPDQYTWWSNRGRAYDNNVGWRIDYQVITKGLESSVKEASIYKEQRFSDHAPLIIDYDIGL